MLFFLHRVLFCLLVCWPVFSWSYFGKTNEGLAVFTWTAGLQSPRSVALEGAAAAQPSDDPGVVFMNPAALRSTHDYQVSAAWQSGDLAERQGLLTFSHPLKSLRIQHTYGFVDNGEVEGYDENGEATGVSSYPLAQMYAATLAMPLSHFQFGFTGRVLWERLSQSADAQTALAGSMDWGLQWTPASPRYGLAFTARNFGTQWRSYVKNGSTDYVTSSNLAASAFFRPVRLPRLTISGEADAPRYAPVALKLGGEYALGNALALRAGVQRNAIDMVRLVRSTFGSNSVPDETGTHRLFSVGAGYQGSWLGVDYSYSHLFESMGGEHRLGLRSGF